MQATPSLDFIPPKPKELSSFAQMLQKSWRNLTTLINNKIGFGDGTNHDNIDGVWANVVAPGVANTNFTVTHNLGRVPVGYWVMQKDRACDIFTGTVAATTTQLTLQATVASAVLRLFIIGLLLGFLSSSSQAQIQGAAHVNVAFKTTTASGTGVSGALLQPIPSATVTVCNGQFLPVSGMVCTGLASLFSNITLTTSQTNPFNADLNGNYSFYAAAGSTYIVSVSAVGLTTYSYVWTAPLAGGPRVQIFAANGTFTIPSGVTTIKVTAIGSGGGGGGGTVTANSAGGGGGSGALVIKWLSGLTPGNTLAVVVGLGGAGGVGVAGAHAVPDTTVSSGTQTITTIDAGNGFGGLGNGSVGYGPGATIATGGDFNALGGLGTLIATSGLGSSGANGPFSGGGGGAGSSGGNNGLAGGAPGAGGGGGGGGTSTTTGGAGNNGLVIFEWVQ